MKPFSEEQLSKETSQALKNEAEWISLKLKKADYCNLQYMSTAFDFCFNGGRMYIHPSYSTKIDPFDVSTGIEDVYEALRVNYIAETLGEDRVKGYETYEIKCLVLAAKAYKAANYVMSN